VRSVPRLGVLKWRLLISFPAGAARESRINIMYMKGRVRARTERRGEHVLAIKSHEIFKQSNCAWSMDGVVMGG